MKPIYRSAIDNPVDYDNLGLMFLQEKYLSILSKVRQRVVENNWFEESVLSKGDYSGFDWNVAARQLIHGFAISDLLNVSPEKLIDLWCNYCMMRIVPIYLMDDSLDSLQYRSKNEAIICNTKASLHAIAALARGVPELESLPGGTAFLRIYLQCLENMAKTIYKEVSTRYPEDLLLFSQRCIDNIDGYESSLRRRSTLDLFARGISAMMCRSLASNEWAIKYDMAGQLLDDISDVWEDLYFGRLTYPISLCIVIERENKELMDIIKQVWQESGTLGFQQLKIQYWPQISKHLIDLSVFDNAFQKALTLIDDTRHGLESESQHENREALLVLVDLKEAFCRRLMQTQCNDKQPAFNFY